MALEQLTEEQIRDWTLEEKDRWWFEKVWKGDMPQLTIRSALTGMILGGVLSLTNLYVGAKTGWSLGVGVTSVILAFSLFKVLSSLKLSSEYTVLENNCMQSIATAAGYMTAPMISSLAAYMMITDKIVPMHMTIAWISCLALLGVLFAFPLKRRFINDEQHPFPEGRAAGIVMDALHTGDAKDGILKAKLLALSGGFSALVTLGLSHRIMEAIHLKMLKIPGTLDAWIYNFVSPKIAGLELRQLSIRTEPDIIMFGAGGLMGIKIGVSIMIGAILNYFVLAPWMISRGDIAAQVTGLMENEVMMYGFRDITKWALWGGVAMMTAASLFAFFSRPQILISAFSGIFRRKNKSQDTAKANGDILRNIELPMRVFVIGIPIVGGATIALAYYIFDVALWQGAIAVPLIFIFTLIGVNSTALTSITPTGALGKLTQLTYAGIAPGNITTNIATASITGEVAGHASNLLMDIKPGYMLGAKPRQQAIGHVLGIFAGALASVPVFYYVFLKGNPQGLVNETYPMPGAVVWKSVAELLTQGIDQLPVSARWAALVGIIVGLLCEILKLATKGRFWLSGVGMGLAMVIPFATCLAMFAGSLFFWILQTGWKDPQSQFNRVIVQNIEPICAGLIAGGALMGILVAVIETFFLSTPGAPH